MVREPRVEASSAYAMGQLQRAFEAARRAGDSQARDRALKKAGRWEAVLAGMADGTLTVGSRTPVADTPAWVTLEVAHGGFPTGRFLAEGPLRDDEAALVASLPGDLTGTTDRERVNLWYLSDAGLSALWGALAEERYRVDVPEEGALLVVAWLLDHHQYEAALDLVSVLRPLMHRLRFTPTFESTPRPAGTTVRRETAGAVAARLRSREPQRQVAAMRETLAVWHPLFDRLVRLWAETVDGDLPRLSAGDDGEAPRVVGGWPCRRWPDDWAERRQAWLSDYRGAVARHRLSRRHLHPKSNFARLRSALEGCELDSSGLSSREVGWIRRALANTVSRHGPPGSEQRAALRTTQAVIAAQPSHADIAQVVAGRLDRYPRESGISAIDPIAADVNEQEAGRVPAGSRIPPHLIEKVSRALEAPVDDLVERGIIPSGEVLAEVLPQISGQVLAANFDDRQLSALYAQMYGAFRRRRSLLLLNLEHQVGFDELPWVAALEPLRSVQGDVARHARQTLERTTLIVLSAFPQSILPNPLVREFGALAERAELRLPLVEEVAADIFMGTFTQNWRHAAAIASRVLEGTLYARYYDLPAAEMWDNPLRVERAARHWGKRTAEDFAALCNSRALEAHTARQVSHVAANGAVLEQSQILTTQNLAPLIDALELAASLHAFAAALADRALAWAVRRQVQRPPHSHGQRRAVKQAAYAWRQAIFFLSFCQLDAQFASLNRLKELVASVEPQLAAQFQPAVDGLEYVLHGQSFDRFGVASPPSTGRRFLGWSVGPHWALPEQPVNAR